MHGNIRLATVRGIPVRLHWTLVLITGLLAVALAEGDLPAAARHASPVALWSVAVVVSILFIAGVLAHEVAHAVVARRYDVEVKGITLWLLGGVSELGDTMPSPRAGLAIAGAGPAASAALGVLFGALAAAGGFTGVFPAVVVAGLEWLAAINVMLAVFNLVPAAPLDGGRLLAAGLWAHHGNRARAEYTAASAGRAFGWVLVGLGVLGWSTGAGFEGIWLVLIGGFLLAASGAEQRRARLVTVFGEATVAEVMTPHPFVLPGWHPVGTVLDGMARGEIPAHHVYPVQAWSGDVSGAVGLDRLVSVAPDERAWRRVQDVMIPLAAIRATTPDARMADVAEHGYRGPVPDVFVFEDGALVGMVTPADVERRVPPGSWRPPSVTAEAPPASPSSSSVPSRHDDSTGAAA